MSVVKSTFTRCTSGRGSGGIIGPLPAKYLSAFVAFHNVTRLGTQRSLPRLGPLTRRSDAPGRGAQLFRLVGRDMRAG
jgi:hypothetical protein